MRLVAHYRKTGEWHNADATRGYFTAASQHETRGGVSASARG